MRHFFKNTNLMSKTEIEKELFKNMSEAQIEAFKEFLNDFAFDLDEFPEYGNQFYTVKAAFLCGWDYGVKMTK
jgi:hypothetical protein